MTEEDQAIVNRITKDFGHKDLKPRKFYTNTKIDTAGKYKVASIRETCALGALLDGNPASNTDSNQLSIWQDAAELLNVSVAVVFGIMIGFDGSKQYSGAEDARGVAIGQAIAEQVFQKPKKPFSAY